MGRATTGRRRPVKSSGWVSETGHRHSFPPVGKGAGFFMVLTVGSPRRREEDGCLSPSRLDADMMLVIRTTACHFRGAHGHGGFSTTGYCFVEFDVVTLVCIPLVESETRCQFLSKSRRRNDMQTGE